MEGKAVFNGFIHVLFALFIGFTVTRCSFTDPGIVRNYIYVSI